MLLAIESSCDESAVALFAPSEGVIWSQVYSQIETHERHGGVVPELAVREHLSKLPELIERMPVPLSEVTKVAVTVGPGLVGSLAMGMAMAQAIGVKYGVPVVGVNHLRAHAYSVWMGMHREDPEGFVAMKFAESLPHLGLLISGGNTMLYRVATVDIDAQRAAEGGGDVVGKATNNWRDVELKLIAKTKDDAAGEALDKGAKMLGLPYPGGPLLEKLARTGNAQAYEFPVAFRESSEVGFSFSGLKTALRYRLQAMSAPEVEAKKADLAASYQAAVVASLRLMVTRCLKRTREAGVPYRTLGVCGGVAQNGAVRTMLADVARENGVTLLAAAPEHCGDNAAMVGFAAWIDEKGVRGSVGGFEPGMGIA